MHLFPTMVLAGGRGTSENTKATFPAGSAPCSSRVCSVDTTKAAGSERVLLQNLGDARVRRERGSLGSHRTTRHFTTPNTNLNQFFYLENSTKGCTYGFNAPTHHATMVIQLHAVFSKGVNVDVRRRCEAGIGERDRRFLLVVFRRRLKVFRL